MHQTRLEGNFVYFVTTVVQDRIKFFEEPLFCELFIDNLRLCKDLKKFKLYGFVVLSNHVHLIISPNDKYNISKVMQSLKKSFSRDFNNFWSITNVGEIHESRLRDIKSRLDKKQFSFNQRKYYNIPNYEKYLRHLDKFAGFPKFSWQKSFYDRIIRNESDFNARMNYIWFNAIKHNLKDAENYLFSSYNHYPDLIDKFEF